MLSMMLKKVYLPIPIKMGVVQEEHGMQYCNNDEGNDCGGE
jgi:hypothetical protein